MATAPMVLCKGAQMQSQDLHRSDSEQFMFIQSMSAEIEALCSCSP